MERIYLDHAATSPVHPQVVEVMLPYLTEHFGNPSSIHQFGRRARQAVDEARRTIANSINASDSEIIFTSGGTEADNMAIIGYMHANQDRGKHLITSAVEHHAVLHTCKHLEETGFEVTYLPVDETGKISIEDLEQSVREDTILVSIMYGNNEVGTLQPIKEIGSYLKDKNIVFHTDAVQAYGTVEIDVQDLNVQFLSVSAHKINGPKGIGFLYASKNSKLAPTLFGGEQERKRRAGTENVAAIVGFQEAVKLVQEKMTEKRSEYEVFRKRILDIFGEENIDCIVNGNEIEHLPHVLNISFPGVQTESLLVNLDLAGIAVSSGSACTAGTVQLSHVLSAMFEDKNRISSSIRFSFGYGNTMEQIEKAANETVKVVKRIKEM
ncbi:cysteine desulfurase family protein [Anaerobacillus sp. MEB173]|uniref:cysteine desulfurase family protein n=1 Tax=Anaerobacillus sp. MEB173 TaxID=3383345 RepID=UPI003F9107BE